ncbi:cupin domain-containing protein [Olivibacter ginsenosidimutans]
MEQIQTLDTFRQYHGGYFKTLLSPFQTGGTMAIMDMTLPQGAEPPLHLHTLEDETFYLLEGRILFRVGDENILAKEGDTVFAIRNIPHDFKIISEYARFITIISPGDFWHYFMEFSNSCKGEPSIIPPQGPPSSGELAKLISRLADRYGLRFVREV